MDKTIEKSIEDYITALKSEVDNLNKDSIKKAIEVIFKAYKKGEKIFIIGNGGSASTASHFACDLGKGTVKNYSDDDESRFKVISLADNIPLMTAYSNDRNYEEIFSQQLSNLAEKGDVLIAISGSGNSKNILKAVEFAKRRELVTIGLIGFDGGELKNMTDYQIIVKSQNYGRIEDLHLVIEHIISQCLRKIKTWIDLIKIRINGLLGNIIKLDL